MRASRADVWWTIIGGGIGVFIVFMIEIIIVQSLGYNQNDQFDDYPMYVTLVCVLWWLFCLIKVFINRFHDLNRSGWWILGFVFPPVALGLLIELLFVGGKEGENKFGKQKSLETIPTYDPKIDGNNQNFEQKKSNENYKTTKNLQNTQKIPTYKKDISAQTNTNISKSETKNVSTSNSNNTSKPQVYTKQPQVHKSSGNYNPYSVSGK